jgi:hypothetical protein
MSGKKGVAPCGHPGTHVTANFVTCDKNCHGIPEYIDTEKTGPIKYEEDDWFSPTISPRWYTP